MNTIIVIVLITIILTWLCDIRFVFSFSISLILVLLINVITMTVWFKEKEQETQKAKETEQLAFDKAMVGCVIIVDPSNRSVTIYRCPTTTTTVTTIPVYSGKMITSKKESVTVINE